MTKLLVPIASPPCAIDGRGVVHAGVIAGRLRAAASGRGRKTFDTVCGRRRTRVLAAVSTTQTGEAVAVGLLWPPRVATLRAEGRTRCGDCFAAHPGRPDPYHWPKTLPEVVPS